jgi:transposase
MGRKPEISYPKRWSIVRRKKNGRTDREVAKSLKISRSTVNTVWNLYKKTRDVRPRKRSGRPKKVNKRVARRIIRIAVRNPLSPVRELKEMMEIENTNSTTLSPTSIKRILIKNGLKARRRPKKWLISESNKIKRVKWCKVMQNFQLEDWQKVVFTDECRIDHGISPLYARSRKEEELNSTLSVQTSRWGVSLHIWGAITVDGVFALHFFEENVTSSTYLSVLKAHLPPHQDKFKAAELIFQHDGAPAHRAHDVSRYLENSGIITLPWPAQSPDLNVIENVWREIKRQLKASYDTVEALKADVVEAWGSIEVSFLQKLYRSMPARLEAVIRAKGDTTKY